jgi:uncharacterized protein YndB with AHSA1/START domain
MTHSIRVERLLNTTPEVACRQWISPEGRKAWFAGKQDDWVVEAETDLRVGGTSWVTWGPAADPGAAWREDSTFEVVEVPGKLVYRSLTTPPPGEGEPLETLVTITFARAGEGKTLLTLEESGYPTVELRDMIEPFVVKGLEYYADSLPEAG